MSGKLALIIGNNNYTMNPLTNCVNDATQLAAALRSVHYTVNLQNNLAADMMYDCIKDFTESIQPKDFIVFFFAGHGVQWGDQNFLLPCNNNKIENGHDIQRYAINAQQTIDMMAARDPRVIIFLLDCCRQYWLPRKRGIRSNEQSVGGLNVMKAPSETLIAFACAPGETVSDQYSNSNNGVFTKCLLKYITSPGMDIEFMLRKVANDVANATNNNQQPYRVSSIRMENVYLVPPSVANSAVQRSHESRTPSKRSIISGARSVIEFESSSITSIRYKTGETDLLESVLDNATDKKLIDRLLGCAYGQALGDAYGLSTEFEERDDVAMEYPDDSKIIPFPNYILTGHNRQWTTGDWTDDTDQWILILITLVFYDGDEKVFARKLKNWILYGYPELGDHRGMELEANTSQVVRSNNYINNPLEASERVWEHSHRQAAPNGAVMRCSASAFVHFNDREKVISTTELMCKTTHFDPRCIASCLAVCLTITYLLTEEVADDDIEALIGSVREETIKILGNRFSKDDVDLFRWYTNERTLEELNLDERGKIGYTYKCLASGFYGLRSKNSFGKTLNDLIRYGGDADTNGAVCGTMYGARYGYRALPYEWLRAMPNKKWFDQILVKCLEKLNLNANEALEVD